MKKTVRTTLLLLLTLVLALPLASCRAQPSSDPWEQALYSEDTELGRGAKTVVTVVEAEGRSVTFTVRTDRDTVGAALLEHGLIDGEDGPYGLYIKVVNGMTADYDIDQSYWAFYVNGEYAMTGIDGAEITEGATYQLVYTR